MNTAQTKNVLLDTQVFEAHGRISFDDPELLTLSRVVRENRAQLFISSIIDLEVRAHLREQSEKAQAELRKALKQNAVLRYSPKVPFPELVKRGAVSDLTSIRVKQWEDWLRDNRVTVHHFTPRIACFMKVDELPKPLREPLEHGRCLYHLERLIDVWLDHATRPLAKRITVVQATIMNGPVPMDHCWLELDGLAIDLTPSIGQKAGDEIVHTHHHQADWYYRFMGVQNPMRYSAMEAIQLVKDANGEFKFWKALPRP